MFTLFCVNGNILRANNFYLYKKKNCTIEMERERPNFIIVKRLINLEAYAYVRNEFKRYGRRAKYQKS